MSVLQHRDPARRMARFYRMRVLADLWGRVTLLREWGRIGSPGRVRLDTHQDEEAALLAAATLAHIKRRKGYG